MTNDKDIKKWREKLSPYVTEVQIKLYKEEKKREQKIQQIKLLKELCENVRNGNKSVKRSK